MLRLEAERFGAAEYDEPRDGRPPSMVRRLTWYVLGAVLVIAVLAFHPAPASQLFLGSGARGTTILFGLLYGLAGAGQAVVYSWYRYGKLRLPEVGSYPGALVNDLVTAFLDEAIFRGALLGLMLLAGINSLAALTIQALVYVLATRAAAPGRDRYMLARGRRRGHPWRLDNDRHGRLRGRLLRPRGDADLRLPGHRTCRAPASRRAGRPRRSSAVAARRTAGG